MKKDYTNGFKSGALHNPLDPLCIDNIRKANQAIADPFTPNKVKHYWNGYLDAILAATYQESQSQ